MASNTLIVGRSRVRSIILERRKTIMETIEEVIKTISIEHLTQEEFVDVVGQIFKAMETMNKTVQLPSRGWDALLEILESHREKHGEFDIVTIMEIHKQIKEQTGI
jgi:hypothetical protein